jgi:hypothetical protein
MMWTVPPLWKDQTAFILAGGPSLRKLDCKRLRVPGAKVMAVNDSWRLVPWLHCLYFTDPSWYHNALQSDKWALDMSINFGQLLYHRLLVNASMRFFPFADHPQVKQLKFSGQLGLETDPTMIRHGSNSGYAVINVAYHLGVKRIVLLGYDMRVVDGRTHWHNENRPSGYDGVLSQSHLPPYPSLVEPLQSAHVEVLNATPDSALDCFPRVELDSVLEELNVKHTNEHRVA